MQAARTYIAGFGTAGSLLAAAAVLFTLASAVVSFHGFPEIANGATSAQLHASAARTAPRGAADLRRVATPPSRRVLLAFADLPARTLPGTARRAGRVGAPSRGGAHPIAWTHTGGASPRPLSAPGPLTTPAGPGPSPVGGTVAQAGRTVASTVSTTASGADATVAGLSSGVGHAAAPAAPQLASAVSGVSTTVTTGVSTAAGAVAGAVTKVTGTLAGVLGGH